MSGCGSIAFLPFFFQAVRLNKYLDFRRNAFIHRKGAKNAKVQLFSVKMLFYSLPSFLSTVIFGGSTAKNKKKYLCVLRVSAVKTT
jgi:hypothetical protein